MMEKLLRLLAEKKGSDLFLSPGSPAHVKINGATLPINQQKLDPGAVAALIRQVVTDRQWQEFEDRRELNIGYSVSEVGSFRINVFRQRGSPACVIRYIPGDIPRFEQLGLPDSMRQMVMEPRGLVLVVGATGSGKSTTLASLIEYRNEHRTGHILTFEDPIEFTFRNKRSIVNQRQIGTDTDSLLVGLRNAMRQAPDCIMIGEIRDLETMSAAIAYAQSGHLVLATLHANNTYNALNRIVSFYPPENRRVMLADLAGTLRSIASQRLIRSTAGGRVPAVELLLNTRYVAELIEQSSLSEVKDAMEKSLAAGSQTFEQALLRMVQAGRISREDALAHADSPTNLLWLLENSERSALGTEGASAAVTTTARRDIDGPSFSEFLLNI
jgi:twitching motility protein PilU